MIIVSRRKKPTPAEYRVERQRQARSAAPLLRDLQASATCVSLQLSFADGTRLAPTMRSFTVYPPARAHFVYACALGDCTGTHDLDDVVHDLLRTGASQASGSRCCTGGRTHGNEEAPPCGLGMTYTITVLYEASQAVTAWPPVAAV